MYFVSALVGCTVGTVPVLCIYICIMFTVSIVLPSVIQYELSTMKSGSANFVHIQIIQIWACTHMKQCNTCNHLKVKVGVKVHTQIYLRKVKTRHNY